MRPDTPQPRALVLALAAALVLAVGADDAAAKKRKSSVSATIDGKQRKWSAKKMTVDVGPGSVAFVATLKRPRRLNQLIPGLSMSCQVDLAGPFPVTPQFPQLCVVGYSEIRFSRNPDPRTWGGSNYEGAVVVTFESLAGNRLSGTFRGTLTSQNVPANPPVSLENGSFSIDLGG